MSFKVTSWELSDVSVPEFVGPEEGEQALFIRNAECDPSDKTAPYKITFESLKNNAVFTLSYWLFTTDRNTGAIIPSTKQMGTLLSLGKALSGRSIGIPNPVDIVGGVVWANVVMSPSSKDPSKKYARAYAFEPVPEDLAAYAQIEQYYIGQELEPSNGVQ